MHWYAHTPAHPGPRAHAGRSSTGLWHWRYRRPNVGHRYRPCRCSSPLRRSVTTPRALADWTSRSVPLLAGPLATPRAVALKVTRPPCPLGVAVRAAASSGLSFAVVAAATLRHWQSVAAVRLDFTRVKLCSNQRLAQRCCGDHVKLCARQRRRRVAVQPHAESKMAQRCLPSDSDVAFQLRRRGTRPLLAWTLAYLRWRPLRSARARALGRTGR